MTLSEFECISHILTCVAVLQPNSEPMIRIVGISEHRALFWTWLTLTSWTYCLVFTGPSFCFHLYVMLHDSLRNTSLRLHHPTKLISWNFRAIYRCHYFLLTTEEPLRKYHQAVVMFLFLIRTERSTGHSLVSCSMLSSEETNWVSVSTFCYKNIKHHYRTAVCIHRG